MRAATAGAGFACLIAAVVGGGIEAFSVTLPVLNSPLERVLIAVLGAAMLAFAWLSELEVHPDRNVAERSTRATVAGGAGIGLIVAIGMAFLYGLTKVVIGRMPEGLDGLYSGYHDHDPLVLVVLLGALLGAVCGYVQARHPNRRVWAIVASAGLIGLSLAFLLPGNFRPVTMLGRIEYAVAGCVMGLAVAWVLERIGL